MRSPLLALVLAAATLAPARAAAPASPIFRIDSANSVAQFTVTKLGFSDVAGRFTESSGDVRWYAPEPESGSVAWRVRVASVRTDSRDRDGALQSADYFDAARHPELSFVSTRVRPISPGVIEVTGRLTMRGVTRNQTLIVRHGGPATRPTFETDFEVDRYDFGIEGGRVMSRLIGRTVRIHLRLITMEHTS